MARRKEFDEELALVAAIDVFREHGFEGTSAEMLVRAMGIGRQSLYDTFGDKWQLYLSAVRATWRARPSACRALRTEPRALDGVRAMIERVIANARQSCLGVNSICEFGRSRPELVEIHDAAARTIQATIVEYVRHAQAEGEISPDLDPKEVAGFLVANFAGVRIAARGGADDKQLRTLGQLMLRPAMSVPVFYPILERSFNLGGTDMKAIIMTRVGGTEVLERVDRPEPVPGPGQALVEVAAAGINFMDTGVRRGLAWTEMPLPRILGVEGSGRVLAVGDGVSARSNPGQRVALGLCAGSYAERVSMPADALVPVPDPIDDRTAAAVMMQGLTASHFATDFYPVQPGDIALVHAAAGGVGLMLTQMIKLRGGHVIGRVSHADKVATAKEAGADHVIVDTEGEFAEDVICLSGGEGVHVVL